MLCYVCCQKIGLKRLVGLYLLSTKTLLCSEECEKTYAIEQEKAKSIVKYEAPQSINDYLIKKKDVPDITISSKVLNDISLLRMPPNDFVIKPGAIKPFTCITCDKPLPKKREMYCSKECRYPNPVKRIRKKKVQNQKENPNEQSFQSILDECISYSILNAHKVNSQKIPSEIKLKQVSDIYREWLGT